MDHRVFADLLVTCSSVLDLEKWLQTRLIWSETPAELNYCILAKTHSLI